MGFINISSQAFKVLSRGVLSIKKGCYIAIGRGENTWDTETTVERTFSSNVLSTVANVGSVVVKSQDLATTYTKNVDYSVNTVSGQITRLIAGSIANNATVSVTYTTLGKFDLDSTELFDEIGRRKANVDYVTLDSEGDIELDGIKYSISLTPTDKVYCRTTFSSLEAAGEDVREKGLFFETIPTGTSTTIEKTFANSQASLVTNVRNVVVKSQDLVTTYVENTDYIVDLDEGKLFRLASGAIADDATVSVTYKTDPDDYIEYADVIDVGLFYGGETFDTVDRDSQGNWTLTSLISIAE